MAKPRKPSKYQSAYEAQYKALQKLVRKAQHKDITLSRSYTPPVPKVLRAQSIAKLERLILQASEIIEEVTKARQTATEEITRSTRSTTQEVEFKKGRFVPEAIRKERARKAAETRRKREEALPTEQREALRRKRAEQFRKNIQKRDTQRKRQDNKQKRKRDRDKQRKRKGGDVVPSKGEIIYQNMIKKLDEIGTQFHDVNDLDLQAKGEDIYRDVLKQIDEIETQYDNPYQAKAHLENAIDLKGLLESVIASHGFDNVMENIENNATEFNSLCEIILYDSGKHARERIDAAFSYLPQLLIGNAVKSPEINRMAQQLAEAHESLNAITEEEFEDFPEGARGFDLPEGW